MPIYVFRCSECEFVWEDFFHSANVPAQVCPACGASAERAHDKENVRMIGDIEPHFNESLGVNIGSRREWREQLAYSNAHDPRLFMNDTPQAGRLVREERDEVEGRVPVSRAETVFEKRRRPGWGENPEGDGAITVDGTYTRADHQRTLNMLKERHRAARSS